MKIQGAYQRGHRSNRIRSGQGEQPAFLADQTVQLGQTYPVAVSGRRVARLACLGQPASLRKMADRAACA